MKKILLAILAAFLLYVAATVSHGIYQFQEQPFNETPPDFLYAHGGNLTYGRPFAIVYETPSHRIQGTGENPAENRTDYGEVKYYRHNNATNKTTELSLEEAEQLLLGGLEFDAKYGITGQKTMIADTYIPGRYVYLFFQEGQTPETRYLYAKEGPGLMKLDVTENVMDYFSFLGWIRE
ncbi:MAG: hypothetical protein HOE53_01005 [Candidatus Magasanikbacteria bacterium]|jgi:hypothetical protein|nr:hypothetical protein [Candidatus Magasanikbacteria bacterium]